MNANLGQCLINYQFDISTHQTYVDLGRPPYPTLGAFACMSRCCSRRLCKAINQFKSKTFQLAPRASSGL